jgi:hypothetical protein
MIDQVVQLRRLIYSLEQHVHGRRSLIQLHDYHDYEQVLVRSIYHRIIPFWYASPPCPVGGCVPRNFILLCRCLMGFPKNHYHGAIISQAINGVRVNGHYHPIFRVNHLDCRLVWYVFPSSTSCNFSHQQSCPITQVANDMVIITSTTCRQYWWLPISAACYDEYTDHFGWRPLPSIEHPVYSLGVLPLVC